MQSHLHGISQGGWVNGGGAFNHTLTFSVPCMHGCTKRRQVHRFLQKYNFITFKDINISSAGINRYTYNDFTYIPSTQGFDFVGHMIPFGGSYSCEETGVR